MAGPAEFFRNKTVCVTGTFHGHTRNTLQSLLTSWGAQCVPSPGRMTDLLLVGDKPGATKVNSATKNGVPMMSQTAFLRLHTEEAEEMAVVEVGNPEPVVMPDHYGSF